MLFDPLLRQRIHQLHGALGQPGEELEAESRLAFVAERLGWHLGGRAACPAAADGQLRRR